MKKFLNPHAYTARSRAIMNKYVMAQLESCNALSAGTLRYPPIFFLGAPRSGSTLAMQVLAEALDLGYISNRHCQWFGAPAVAERLLRPLGNRPCSDHASIHGVTGGSYEPAECGQWWYRFFPKKPAYVTNDDVDPKKMLQFRRSVAALTNAFDRPVLFKNLYASLRILPIMRYMPESLFIVTHRDEIGNGHSLLETRYRTSSDYQKWWSMEPPGIEHLAKLPAHEQVIEQIRAIHTVIERDLDAGGVCAKRRFDLSYEDLCANPAGTVQAVQDFLRFNNCEVKQLRPSPDGFQRRDEVRINTRLYQAMSDYAQNG